MSWCIPIWLPITGIKTGPGNREKKLTEPEKSILFHFVYEKVKFEPAKRIIIVQEKKREQIKIYWARKEYSVQKIQIQIKVNQFLFFLYSPMCLFHCIKWG